MKSIVTRTAEYSCLEEDIYLCKLIEGVEIDVEDTNDNLKATMEIAEGKFYAVLVDGRVQVSITKEGMANSVRPEFHKNLIANAILVNSLANRLVGNFIIKFHKPSSPTKLFSDYTAALEWLRESVKNRNQKLKQEKNRLGVFV